MISVGRNIFDNLKKVILNPENTGMATFRKLKEKEVHKCWPKKFMMLFKEYFEIAEKSLHI